MTPEQLGAVGRAPHHRELARFQRAGVRVLLAGALLLGVFQSLRLTFHLWGADADVADPVLLWQGLHTHGLWFLTHWRFTPDNWLLSLLPIDSALFAVFGAKPFVMVLTGALFFFAVVALTASLVWRERGGVVAAIVAIVLLFAGRPALGADGFLAYPVSHGISLAWGLLGLFLFTLWLDGGRAPTLVGGAVGLFIAAFSDPWVDVAFLAPIAAVAFVLLVLHRRDTDRRRLFLLLLAADVGATLAAAVAVKIFGLFGNLHGPPHSLAPIGRMVDNAAFVARYVAVYVNLIPGTLPGAGALPSWPVTVVSCAVVVSMLAFGTIRFAACWRNLPVRRVFVAGTALVSILLMVPAIVSSPMPLGMVTGRYFANLFVFFPLFVVLIPLGASSGRPAAMALIGVLASASVVSGMVSGSVVWNDRPLAVSLKGIPKLASFLRSHGLSFGFGPYWPTQANAVAWVTHGRETIRPVRFDHRKARFVPKTAQTLPSWYTRAGLARVPERMFLMELKAAGTCAPFATCRKAVVAQFGRPAEVLQHGAFDVFVFDRKIIP